MRLDHKGLKRYLTSLEKKLQGKVLGVPTLFNSKTMWFPLLNENEHLMIGLRTNTPFIYLTEVTKGCKPINDPLLNPFRENLTAFYVEKISLKEDDYIIFMDIILKETGEKKCIIIELFNTRPNLLLVDENDYIVASFKESRLEKYHLFHNEKFKGDGETRITEFFKLYFEREKSERIEEKYGYFFKDTMLALKKIERAIDKETIDDDSLLDASSLLIDQAKRIISCGVSIREHRDHIIDYEDKRIDLDVSLTIGQNADALMKKASKLTGKVKKSQENLIRLYTQKRFYIDLLEKFDNALNDEQREKVIDASGLYKVKGKAKETPFNVPYKINHNGLIIYFGKNAKQNDYLSFSLPLDRDFTWLHVKDYHGAHVVLCKKKPNEKELTLTGEIALLVSHLDVGLVSYTLKKNIRKGKNMGEVILKNYSTMKINNVSDLAKELVSKAEKK